MKIGIAGVPVWYNLPISVIYRVMEYSPNNQFFLHCSKKPRKVVTFGRSRLTGHGDNGHNNKLVGLLSILVTKLVH